MGRVYSISGAEKRGRAILRRDTSEKRKAKLALLKKRKELMLVPPPIPKPVLPEEFTTDVDRVTDDQIRQYARQIESYKKKPLNFVKYELGIPTDVWPNDCPPTSWSFAPQNKRPLWSAQRDILQAVVDHRKVAVKSGHDVGKTFLASIVTLYLSYVWNALGVTTAPTFRQVKRLLWAEIRSMWFEANSYQTKKQMPGLGGKLLQTSLELGEKWYTVGFATDDPESNMPGFHADQVFVVIDEANGVDPVVFDMMETIISSENAFVFMIGNPVNPAHPFKKICEPGSGYKTFTIDCRKSPNVVNKKVIYPPLCAPMWPERMRKKWGADSSLYLSRVCGEFPEEVEDSLIPVGDIMAALSRNTDESGRKIEDHIKGEVPVSIGLDVARQGGDRIIGGVRYSTGRYRIEIEQIKRRLNYTAGKVIQLHRRLKLSVGKDGYELYREMRKKREDLGETEFKAKSNKERGEETPEYEGPVINVDDIGVGGGVTDTLYEQDFPVNGINVSEEADETIGEATEIEFINKRAQYFWRLREAFTSGHADIDDEELAQELMYLKSETTGRGKIKIIPKEKIKKALGRSPDKAESMMLAWAEDVFLEEREICRFL